MTKEARTTQLIVSIFRRAAAPLMTTLIAAVTLGCAIYTEAPRAASIAGSREDIDVLRSLREDRITKSDWCTVARTGFEPSSGGFLVEDRYTMWAIAVRPGDGQIVDAKAKKRRRTARLLCVHH